MKEKWPQVLYLTPPDEGGNSYALAGELEEVVRFLRFLGQEWGNISPEALTRLNFGWELKPDQAVYEMAGASSMRVVVALRGDGPMDRYIMVRLYDGR